MTFYPKNQGLPTHHAVILLFDPETGEPLAAIDGRLITEMRTAAVSAVATKLLARMNTGARNTRFRCAGGSKPSRSSSLVRAFREVRVWSPKNSRVFAEQHGVKAFETAAEAVRELI